MFITALFGASLLHASSRADGDSPDLLVQVLREASLSASSNLRSFVAEGKFRVLRRDKREAKWREVDVGDIRVSASGPKYNVKLNYHASQDESVKRVIIYDSVAIMSSEFSPRISKTGCQAEVFSVDHAAESGHIKSLFLPWDMAKLSKAVVDIDGILREHPDYASKIARTAEGDMVMSIDEPGYSISVVFAKVYGFNPSSFQVFVNNDVNAVQERSATWKYDGSFWHVASLRSVLNPKDDGITHELELNQFEANAEVPESEFQLGALELPGGTRILDHRPEAKRKILYKPAR